VVTHGLGPYSAKWGVHARAAISFGKKGKNITTLRRSAV